MYAIFLYKSSKCANGLVILRNSKIKMMNRCDKSTDTSVDHCDKWTNTAPRAYDQSSFSDVLDSIESLFACYAEFHICAAILDNRMSVVKTKLDSLRQLLKETIQLREQPNTCAQSSFEKTEEVIEPIDLSRRATDEGPGRTTETSLVTEEPRVSIETLNIREAINKYKLTMPGLEEPNVEIPRHEDISDLPTQKLETLSQIAKKRTTGQGEDESPLLQETDQPRRTRTQWELEKIVEVEENPAPTEQDLTTRATEGPAQTTETSLVTKKPRVSVEPLTIREAINKYNFTMPGLEEPNLEVPRHEDIADLPTQKLETLSQIAKKRTTGEGEDESPPKRVRPGSVSFKESQQQRTSQEPPQVPITDPEEAEKENMQLNIQEPPVQSPVVVHRSQVASPIRQEAGLSDMHQYPQPQVEPQAQTQGRKEASEGSETPLGSLDRTKVSLGDSAKTTDDQLFLRKQWGCEKTMMKIMECIKRDGAVTMQSLLERGPLLPGQTSIIAALCFTSILRLKQHGFIRMVKDPDTLEIRDIMLGPRFDLMRVLTRRFS